MSENIMYVKLTSGEELITEVISDDDVSVKIKNPLRLQEVVTDEGNKIMILVIVFPFSIDGTMLINTQNIVMSAEIKDELKEHYKYNLELNTSSMDSMLKDLSSTNDRMKQLLVEGVDSMNNEQEELKTLLEEWNETDDEEEDKDFKGYKVKSKKLH